MSKKLIFLLPAMVVAGGVAAIVFSAKDSPALKVSLSHWDQSPAAVTAAPGVAFAQDAPAPGGAPGGGGAVAEPGADGAAAGAPAAGAGKPASADQLLEQLKAWSAQDPRTIIDKKFEDLQGKETKPWDDENPETYIPDTGRNDPLTPIRDALPEELRPPRGGDDDENEIMTYLFTQYATQAVDAVMNNLQVYSMVQIGLRKLVTMGVPGQRPFTVEEGQSSGFDIDIDGYLVSVDFSVAAVSEDDVTLVISGSPRGSTVSVTKEAHFIPGTPSNAMGRGDNNRGRGGRGNNRGGGGGGG